MHRLVHGSLVLLLSLALPQWALGQESTDEVAQEATEAASDQPLDGAQAYQRAVAARKAGDTRTALEEIGEAQRAAPDNGTYIHERVLILESMGELELAATVLEEQRDAVLAAVGEDEVVALEQRLVPAALPDRVDEVPGNEVADDKEDLQDRAHTPTVGYVLLGVGSTFVASSGALFLVAYEENRRLECTLGTSACSGVTPIDNLSASERDRRLSRVDTMNVAGAVALGTGIGLMGWGLWQVLTFKAHDTVSVGPMAGPDLVGVILRQAF